ncbi:MAG: hypothetical protein ACYS3S_14565 [Planctomycetota bacterium]
MLRKKQRAVVLTTPTTALTIKTPGKIIQEHSFIIKHKYQRRYSTGLCGQA